MSKIDKNSVIEDVLNMDNETSKFFLEIGMHCLDCPFSRQETIEQACQVHGTDAEKLVEKINEYLESKN